DDAGRQAVPCAPDGWRQAVFRMHFVKLNPQSADAERVALQRRLGGLTATTKRLPADFPTTDYRTPEGVRLLLERVTDAVLRGDVVERGTWPATSAPAPPGSPWTPTSTVEAMRTRCPACTAVVAPDARFCPHCGVRRPETQSNPEHVAGRN